MSNAWAVVAAALGSSFLMLLGSYWLERWRVSRSERAIRNKRLSDACVILNQHSIGLSMRAKTMYETAILRSGLTEGLNVFFHIREPLDLLRLHDWLQTDAGPILGAFETIRVYGSSELIESAEGVVTAGASIIYYATRLKTSELADQNSAGRLRRIVNFAKLIRPIQRSSQFEQQLQQEEEKLGKAISLFAQRARNELGVSVTNTVALRAMDGNPAEVETRSAEE